MKTQSNVTNLEKMDSSLTKSDKKKEDILSDYFSSVFTRENCARIPDFEEKEFETPFYSININIKVLQELNTGKSMEPDELNPFLLKSMSKSFAVPLTLIFQESLKSAQIPKAWKDARVTPIFKNVRNLSQITIVLLASHQ